MLKIRFALRPTAEMPQVVGEGQHEVPLQYVGLDVFHQNIGHITADTDILLQQVKDTQTDLAALIGEYFLADAHVPDHVIGIVARRKAGVELVAQIGAIHQPFPDDPRQPRAGTLVEVVLGGFAQGTVHDIIAGAGTQVKIQILADIAA